MTAQRRIIATACTALALCSAAPSLALEVTFGGRMGEIVEGLNVFARVMPSNPMAYPCLSGGAAREGNIVRISVRAMPLSCADIELGRFAAGVYDVHTTFRDGKGVVLEESTSKLQVLPLEGRCNADPLATPAIWGDTPPGEEGPRAAAINSDAAFLQRFPGAVAAALEWGITVSIPPLQDAPPVAKYLEDNYTWWNSWDYVPSDFVLRQWSYCDPNARDVRKPFLEYVNADLGTYFYTSDEAEMAAIDAGRMGAWSYTGQYFFATAKATCATESRQDVVYRFAGATAASRSHLFTSNREECHAVDKSRSWAFEGVAFWSRAPRSDGTCAATFDKKQQIPLYRVWRPFDASAHRLTTQRSVVDEMTAKGWVDEGVAMCVLADE